MSVQKNILAQMTKCGLSTRSLAKTIGVDPHTMSEMLKGETEIEYHYLKRIAAALRVTADDLEQESDDTERSLLAIMIDNIMTYRQKRGITQVEFARRCGLSQSYICRLERQNQQSVTLTTLITFAKAMNISVPQLLTPNCEPISTPPQIAPTDPPQAEQTDLYTTIYMAVKAALKEAL